MRLGTASVAQAAKGHPMAWAFLVFADVPFQLSLDNLGRMADVVETDVAFDPVDVGLFGADGIVFDPDGVTDSIEQFPRSWFHRLFHLQQVCLLWFSLDNMFTWRDRVFRKRTRAGPLFGRFPQMQL